MTRAEGPEPRTLAYLSELYSLGDRVAIVTGGSGVLGRAMARGLARAGASVGILGRRRAHLDPVVEEIQEAGGAAIALPADVLSKEQLEIARDAALQRWGKIDILVNAAGGNVPAATLTDAATIFDLPEDAIRQVLDLNVLGTWLPSQVFGEALVRQRARTPEGGGRGCIVNISSMAAQRAMTRVGGYGAAKAAVENLTRWMAVELARKHGAGLRVNAIAPGFFVGDQNRDLLITADGTLTARGQAILAHTPAGRFGDPDDLVGTLTWLCSPSAGFVNGVVVPIDGGFSAFSGV
jgi:NAD(P)-dependent dehydrogenase (short-subunit alcohol dehydrogenase family)